MLKTKKYHLFVMIVIAGLLVTSCGQSVDNQSAIQTSVAETVAAQAPVEPIIITESPAATPIPSQTPFAQPTAGLLLPTPTLPAAPSGSKAECASASLQDETIVDGTIFKPGEQFTKTWYITNTSTCVWDTNYKIIFWDGDILGGGYVYNLPQAAGPGQTIPVSLVLTAPTADGAYRSEWKLQTPDNINFGVGMYQSAFYTDIVVSSSTKPAYAVTSVELAIDREPDYGCQPANMVYTAYATFTTNGPLEFQYRWEQQDGNGSGVQTIKMTGAGKKTVTREWKLGRAASQNSNRWFQIILVDPVYREYPQVGFTFECP
ncbi:MAG TPA: NBR1-Ig-like domain-containing protein [Anaerolineales bacterium]|nr:NBR1-Ig-like domain-containing protein [Anaerolineales bacterium]